MPHLAQPEHASPQQPELHFCSRLNHLEYMPTFICTRCPRWCQLRSRSNCSVADWTRCPSIPHSIVWPHFGYWAAIEIERGTVSRVGAQKKVHQDKEREFRKKEVSISTSSSTTMHIITWECFAQQNLLIGALFNPIHPLIRCYIHLRWRFCPHCHDDDDETERCIVRGSK